MEQPHFQEQPNQQPPIFDSLTGSDRDVERGLRTMGQKGATSERAAVEATKEPVSEKVAKALKGLNDEEKRLLMLRAEAAAGHEADAAEAEFNREVSRVLRKEGYE